MVNLKGLNKTSIQQENRAKILQTFFLHAPISRIEIANITSLTPPTITSNVAHLIETGLVKECLESTAKKNIALGRKPIPLDIVKDACYAIGVDWSPNGIICLITDLRGNIVDRVERTIKNWEFTATVGETAMLVKQLVKKNHLSQKKILGIGVGVPGFVEIESGLVRCVPAYGWKNAPAGKMLEEQTGFPVCVENNVRVMAIGETLFSWWKNKDEGITDNFLYVFVGEGIACAIVHNDELLRGNIFGAGELGHNVVSWDGEECRCGKKGCLEAIAGEYAIKKRVAKAFADTPSSILKKEIKNPSSPSISDILNAWEQGDKTVKEILGRGIQYLGGSIANVINLINPGLVLIEGNLFSRPELNKQLLKAIREHTFALTDSETLYKFKNCDINRCSVGAAACAIRHFLVNQRA